MPEVEGFRRCVGHVSPSQHHCSILNFRLYHDVFVRNFFDSGHTNTRRYVHGYHWKNVSSMKCGSATNMTQIFSVAHQRFDNRSIDLYLENLTFRIISRRLTSASAVSVRSSMPQVCPDDCRKIVSTRPSAWSDLHERMESKDGRGRREKNHQTFNAPLFHENKREMLGQPPTSWSERVKSTRVAKIPWASVVSSRSTSDNKSSHPQVLDVAT